MTVNDIPSFFRIHPLLQLEKEAGVYRRTLRSIRDEKSFNISSLRKLVGRYGYEVKINLIPREALFPSPVGDQVGGLN